MDDEKPILLDPIYRDGRTPEYLDPHPVPGSSDTLPKGLALADTSRPPFSATGRLSVYRPGVPEGERLQHGTAHFIAPDLLLTAAHMVWWNEGGASEPGDLEDLPRHQIEEHRFVPAYTAGTEPAQVFEVEKIAILQGWPRWRLTPGHRNAAWKYDVAILRVAGTWDGPVTPMAALEDSDVDVRAIGYPGNFHGGRRMICATGELLTDGAYGGTVGMEPNPMGEGASGGPWIVQRSEGDRVIGVTSFPETDEDDADDSPVFGPAAMRLIEAIRAPA